ncbi:unnamed protein product, partial [marine sediment metagenome]
MSELRHALKASLKMGLILGLVAVFVALTGLIEDFNELDVISGVIGLGHAILLLISMVGGYVAVGTREKRGYLTAGLMGGADRSSDRHRACSPGSGRSLR